MKVSSPKICDLIRIYWHFAASFSHFLAVQLYFCLPVSLSAFFSLIGLFPFDLALCCSIRSSSLLMAASYQAVDQPLFARPFFVRRFYSLRTRFETGILSTLKLSVLHALLCWTMLPSFSISEPFV